MIAVLTGDIVDSTHHDKAAWLPALRSVLVNWGKEGKDFEIYRGDEFQLRLKSPDKAVLAAISIKARLKAVADTDIRISIGLGGDQEKQITQEDKTGNTLTLSTSPAFILSGRTLDELKANRIHLGIATGNEALDLELNLLLQWILLTADGWSTVSAETLDMALTYPGMSQKEMAASMNVQQSAISQRLKRANYDLLMETLSYFEQKIGALCH